MSGEIKNTTPVGEATWSPEAGGYVYNGNVVSNEPVYQNNSNTMSTTVDVSKLNNNQGTGLPTLNQEGSNTDVNASQTQIGSLNSNALNTETTNSALSSPATNSNLTISKPTDPTNMFMEDYSRAQQNNDFQGQINALVAMDKYNAQQGITPQYTQQIAELQQQRSNKIETISSAYDKAIQQAIASGDSATVQALATEFQNWKGSVDYDGYIENMKEDINLDYQMAYKQSLNDICNTLMSLTDSYLNFQYDPSTDQAFQIASGYAVGRVKEIAGSTGMYYSSATQHAVTRAISELIPTYEGKAKESIEKGISMIQNLGSYLMNMEQFQYNMWKDQINLKWAQAEEERKEFKYQLERIEAMGYVDNPASIVTGMPAGALSPSERKRLQTLEDQKEMKWLDAQISQIMAQFNHDLTLERDQRLHEFDMEKIGQQHTNTLERDKILYEQELGKLAIQNGSTSAISGSLYSGKYTGELKTVEDFENYYKKLQADKTTVYNPQQIAQLLRNNAGSETALREFCINKGIDLDLYNKLTSAQDMLDLRASQQIHNYTDEDNIDALYKKYGNQVDTNKTEALKNKVLTIASKASEMSSSELTKQLNSLIKDDMEASFKAIGKYTDNAYENYSKLQNRLAEVNTLYKAVNNIPDTLTPDNIAGFKILADVGYYEKSNTYAGANPTDPKVADKVIKKSTDAIDEVKHKFLVDTYEGLIKDVMDTSTFRYDVSIGNVGDIVGKATRGQFPNNIVQMAGDLLSIPKTDTFGEISHSSADKSANDKYNALSDILSSMPTSNASELKAKQEITNWINEQYLSTGKANNDLDTATKNQLSKLIKDTTDATEKAIKTIVNTKPTVV